jgi:hypothetical protein
MACDDDCPGDTRDPVMMEVLIALVETVRCGYVHREPKLKMETATDSVGWLNTTGPLPRNPRFPKSMREPPAPKE